MVIQGKGSHMLHVEESVKFEEQFTDAFLKFRPRLKEMYQDEKLHPISPEVWELMANLGWFGCVVPTEYGGNERGLSAMASAAEAITKSGVTPVFAVLTALSAVCIARFGSESLKQKYLPEIAKGAIKFAFAATEERAGFNMLEIDTFARKDGDHYVINGAKMYISGFDLADNILLVARTMTLKQCKEMNLPKTAGISLFVVGTDQAGITKHRLNTRGEGYIKQFALSFENVRISAQQLLGKEHEGASALFTSFNVERVLFVAFALGSIQYCLDIACDYARTRRVFGDNPIGKYQSIQHPLADAKIRSEAVRQLLLQAVDMIEQGGDPAKVSTMINSAKYLVSEAGSKALDASMDALGGRAFNEDYGIIQLAETMRLLRLSPISNSLILNDIAERVLCLPRSY